MNEEKTLKQGNLFYRSTIFIMFLANILFICLYVNTIQHNSTLSGELLKKTSFLNSVTKKNKQLNIDLIKTKEELENLKSRITGIKDNDDLLKRDIEMYIQQKYQKVPKSVAKTTSELIVDQSKKEEIAPELIVGIIQVESQFNPMAVGPKTKYGHARGLMQVMPEWAKKFNLKSMYDLHDIDVNIICGIKVFKIHLKEGKGNISEGLYLYVNKDRSYVDKVYNAMGKFVSFRSTVDDSDKNKNDEDDENIKKDENDSNERTANNS